MAKKNEILLSIALEGDQDVKSKLKAVGDEGKKSLAEIERNAGRAGESIGKRFTESAAAPLSKVQEALTPFLEGAGLASLGSGGLIGRLIGAAGPAAAVAGLGALALQLARIGEETDRQKARLKGLGDTNGFGKLTDQAKQLGSNVGELQPRYEKFLAFQQKANAENRTLQGSVDESAGNVRVVGGGANNTPPTGKAFQAFDRALFESIRKDVGNEGQAHSLADQFNDSLFQNGRLTSDALRSLQKTAPSAANFITDSVSPSLGRRFANPNELAALIDRGGARVGTTDLVNEAAKRAPEADKQAEASRGVTEAFGALESATKRLIEQFGGDRTGIGKGIDAAAKRIDQGADQVDKFVHGADNQPGGKNFIGPVRAEDVPHAPQSLGEVFSSDKGDLLGRLVGYIREGATNNGAGSNPLGVITDFITKALSNPGAISGNNPAPIGPGGLTPEGLAGTRIPSPFGAAPEPPQQRSELDQQQTAGLGSAVQEALRSLVQGIAAGANAVNPQDTRVQGPVDGIGIRGALEDSTRDVASSVKDAGAELTAAIAGIAANIKNSGGGAPVTVQAAAGGGMIRRLDDGGHVSGPGTTTSDSIPAMLSDGEYVIRAAAARKLGRSALDGLNAGGFADGGSVNASDLAAGTYDITATDDGGAIINGVLYGPGSPLLQDPIIQQALRRARQDRDKQSKAKHKSDFVGTFGGHVFDDSGSYASGGPVGSVARFGDSIGHFFSGGGAGAAMSMGELGAGAEALHPVTIAMPDGRSVTGLRAPPEVVDALRKEARDGVNFQAGPRPSWFEGQ